MVALQMEEGLGYKVLHLTISLPVVLDTLLLRASNKVPYWDVKVVDAEVDLHPHGLHVVLVHVNTHSTYTVIVDCGCQLCQSLN